MTGFMRRPLLIALILTLFLVVLAGKLPSAQAAPGIPGSPEFGSGARLDPRGANLEGALATLTALHLDWIAIEYSWADFVPSAESSPDYTRLDQAVNAAQSAGSAVMLALTNAPAWAATADGPDPVAVSSLISSLRKRYPGGMQALELFPAPNTRRGWGASPSPEAYLKLYRAIEEQLQDSPGAPLLVLGGIEALSGPQADGSIDDIDFLNRFLNLAQNVPVAVVGLRFPGVQGSADAPDTGQRPSVLRHYEEIRRLIKNADRASSRLWITYLGLPRLDNPAEQAGWLDAAYHQMRSQLYIGAAFLGGMNTCPEGNSCAEVSLLESDGSPHPIIKTLNEQNPSTNEAQDEIPGRAKSSVLFKPR